MKLIIELNEANGQLLVNGDCLMNKVASLGMLEMAKTMIANPQVANVRPTAPAIEVPNGPTSKLLLNGK